jgi:hypothetical protein
MNSPSTGTFLVFFCLLLFSILCLVKPILVLRVFYGWGYYVQDKFGYRFTNKQTEFLKRLKESPETLKEVDPMVFKYLELSGYIGIFMVSIFICSIFGVFRTQ